MDVLPLLPSPYSFHLFDTPYVTRPFSQDPGLCYRSLSTDLSSSLWCLSQAPSTNNRPQLLHRQDVALLQLLHCARSQQHVLGLLISVPSNFSRVATPTTFCNQLSYFPPWSAIQMTFSQLNIPPTKEGKNPQSFTHWKVTNLIPFSWPKCISSGTTTAQETQCIPAQVLLAPTLHSKFSSLPSEDSLSDCNFPK